MRVKAVFLILAVTLALALVTIKPVYAVESLPLYCGFEDEDDFTGYFWTANNYELNSTHSRKGTYSITEDGTGQFLIKVIHTAVSALNASTWVYLEDINTTGNDDGDYITLLFVDTTGAEEIFASAFYSDSESKVLWSLNSAALGADNSTVSVVSDHWTHVRIEAEISTSASIKLYIDDTEVCSLSGNNNQAEGFSVTGFSGLEYSGSDNLGMDAYFFDDLQVNDGSLGTFYNFYGCFSEWGIGEDDTVITAFMVDEQPTRFDLNGTHVTWYSLSTSYTEAVNSSYPYRFYALNESISFSYELGYNTSRIYYTINGNAENIWVIVPYETELWNTYAFYIVGYAEIDWGYLELQLPINGTETEIERWDIKTMNDISLVLVWGKTYHLELITSKGSYTLPTFTAGATQEKTIAITQDMFYESPADLGELTMTAERDEITGKITFTFDNDYEDTEYFNITLYESNNSTAEWSYQVDDTDSVSTYYAYAEPKGYTAILTCSSTELGVVTRTFVLPYEEYEEDEYESHPFAFLRLFGKLPFDVAQLPAVAVLLIVGFTISWYHLEWGLVLEVLLTIILVYFKFLLMSWSWVGVAATIGMLLAFSERRTREVS